jgi:hypothetical protein
MNHITKQEIIDKYHQYLFDCKGRVEEVRNFLELNCGFGHATWLTEKHLNLKYLYIIKNFGDRTEVHGTNALWGSRTVVDVYKLMDDIDLCKHISLKV